MPGGQVKRWVHDRGASVWWKGYGNFQSGNKQRLYKGTLVEVNGVPHFRFTTKTLNDKFAESYVAKRLSYGDRRKKVVMLRTSNAWKRDTFDVGKEFPFV